MPIHNTAWTLANTLRNRLRDIEWGLTPQGYAFWMDVDEKLSVLIPLPTPIYIDGYWATVDLPSLLSQAFAWSDTRPSRVFWETVYAELQNLNLASL